jgi:hypothetical protein
MPTPQAILAESKMNWRRAAPFFGDMGFIAFTSVQFAVADRPRFPSVIDLNNLRPSASASLAQIK